MHQLLLSLALACATEEPAAPRLLAEAVVPFAVADFRVVELGGASGMEVLFIGAAGEVRSWSLPREPKADGFRGSLQLAQPSRSVLALTPSDGRTALPDLHVLDDRGVRTHPLQADGSHAKDAVELTTRLRLSLRTGIPRFAPFAPDIDRDGLPELVAPRGGKLEIWKRPVATGEGKGEYARLASVRIATTRGRKSGAALASDVLESVVRIPSLRLLDQNGDGKDDIWVEEGEQRAWHIVSADSRIPEEPTRTLDLSLFRDTSSESGGLQPGRVLAGLDQASLQARDLDLDGVVDFVIAHRRKVWVFPGTKSGPQFEQPSAILKSADDATLILLVPLDDDERPDLLVLRVVVPGVGTLIRGLVSEWEVQMDALAYQNTGGCQFGKEPYQRSSIVFRLPPILDVVRDPEKILARFETAGQDVRQPVEGDWNGDGRMDVAVLDGPDDAPESRIDLWSAAEGSVLGAQDDERLLRRLLFEEQDKTWDLDRAVEWLSSFGQGRLRDSTQGRAPGWSADLPDRGEWRVHVAQAADLDGDGRQELLLVRKSRSDSSRRQILVYGLPR